jgi:bidirectional [NiFe] hydrogenase diaphorase subunit
MPIIQENPQTHPSSDKRFKMLTATMKRYQYSADALIEVLHQAQELFGYLGVTTANGQKTTLDV